MRGPSAEDSGLREVLEALRSLPSPPSLPSAAQHDGEVLAEVLFDRFPDFTPAKFFHLLRSLRLPELERKADAVLARCYLFLDPGQVARHAMVRLVTDVMNERRIHPYAAWEDRALEEIAEMARIHPQMAPMRTDPEREGQLETGILMELTRFYNSMARGYRRLVWLAWVQKKEIPRIAEETGIPYERVEWIPAQVHRDVEDIVQSHLERRLRYADDDESADSPPADDQPPSDEGEEMEQDGI